MKLTTNHLFCFLAASTVVLTAACTDDGGLKDPQAADDSVFGDGQSIVSLTVNSEAHQASSRSLEVGKTISDGSQANVLIFAVYEKNATDGLYKIAPQFKSATKTVTSNDGSTTFGTGVGQNAVEVTKWPCTIKFAVDPSKEYKIAFWAQNKDSKAYDTDDLTGVTIDYANAVNNDEFRDAFCAVADSVTSATAKEIILHRPFAQINVGTSGADYNNILNGANVVPNKKLRYSTITVDDVYSTFDVVNDKPTGSTTTAIFKWAPMPAFIHYEKESVDTISNLLQFPDEEYLKVRLNENVDTLASYKTSYPTYNTTNGYLTETFKYLSMCYVLVASPESGYDSTTNPNPANKNKYDKYNSTTLSNVKISFSEFDNGKDSNASYNDTIPNSGTPTVDAFAHYIWLKNVPVHRNWRTNILGGLADPDDPNDPDDPTSVFQTAKVCVHLCPIYYNEYNGVFNDNADGTTADQTEWKPNEPFPTESGSLHDQNENHSTTD